MPTRRLLARLDDQAAAIRRLTARLDALSSGGGHPDMRGAVERPTWPGSIWNLLAKLAWSDQTYVRAHSIPMETLVQGVAGADGSATETTSDVVARSYFLVHQITGHVERDATAAGENNSSHYLAVQLEDDARQYPVFRETMRMGPIAGTADVPGIPLSYAEYPLAFLPDARIIATFTPLNGFPSAASAATGLTTRMVGLYLHGVLVQQGIVDRLLEQNRVLLARGRLTAPPAG